MLVIAKWVVLVAALQAAVPATSDLTGLPFVGEEAEQFLSTAEVLELKNYDTKGITKPRRATLSDGRRTARAVFKDVEKLNTKEKLTSGRTVYSLKDSYRHEIAAYELDKLIGLGMVPPCVERKIGSDTGSLCLWVEGAMTEWERRQVKQIMPPDVHTFNHQMHTAKLFMQLTYDVDYNNASNLLIDGNWKLYKVDSSRAFRNDRTLRREGGLTRFSRSVLTALQELSTDDIRKRLGPWLAKGQIKGLLARRDAILELAERRVAEQGEAAVLYP